MLDPRLPISLKKLPGGYRLQCGDGRSSVMVYGTGTDTAHATGTLTTDEAKAFADELVRILTDAWTNADEPG